MSRVSSPTRSATCAAHLCLDPLVDEALKLLAAGPP